MTLVSSTQDRENQKFREVISGTPSVGVNLDGLIAGEDATADRLKTEDRYSYWNSGDVVGTTTVKSGAGYVKSLTINTPVASSVIRAFDSIGTSATLIATYRLPATLLSDGPKPVPIECTFATGLTVAISGGTADVTVAYR